MNKSKSFAALTLTLIFAVMMYCGSSKAASYDIKEDTATPSLIAKATNVHAEKVMDGVVDGIFEMRSGKVQQKFIMQCDKNQETVTMYYYMNDTTGYKAKGATGFKITAYNSPDEDYTPGGAAFVYDSADSTTNLQEGITRLNALVKAKVGAVVFEFYEDVQGIGQSPVAYSMMISPSAAVTALNKMNVIQNGVCDIDGGFSTVTPLARLKDSL